MEKAHHHQGLVGGHRQVGEGDQGKAGQADKQGAGFAQHIGQHPGGHLKENAGDGGDGHRKAQGFRAGPQGGGEQRQHRGAGQGPGGPGLKAHGAQAVKDGDRFFHVQGGIGGGGQGVSQGKVPPWSQSEALG